MWFYPPKRLLAGNRIGPGIGRPGAAYFRHPKNKNKSPTVGNSSWLNTAVTRS